MFNKYNTVSTLALSLLLSTSFLVSAESKPETSKAVGSPTLNSTCPAFLDESVRKLNSKESLDLCKEFAGKTFLIVNTASHCGFTPQFKSLEKLYQTYKDQGLVVLGFPSDNFFQEEDLEKDTAKVCFVNYGVTFPMFNTIVVRGDDSHPIFAHLADKTASPYWNFYKYLVSADGETIQRFSSKVEPMSKELVRAIEAQL